MASIRYRRYRPTELAELSDAEIYRMIRSGYDPARGLDKNRVATILKHAIEKLAARPQMLRVLARAVAAERELARARRALQAPLLDTDTGSSPASDQLY